MVKKNKEGDIKIAADDLRFVGAEPRWDHAYTPMDVAQAYNWYNYVLEDKDRQKIVADYVSAEDAPAIMACEPWRVTNLIAALCRMEKRGYFMQADQAARHKAMIQNLIDYGRAKLNTPKKAAAPVKVVKVSHIADFDDHLDDYLIGGMKKPWDVDVLATLKQWNPNKESLAEVVKYYTEQAAEIANAREGLIEGYESFTKKQLTNLHGALTEIAVAAAALASQAKTPEKPTAKKPRKKRAKKPVDPAKATAKFKFMQEHAELGLTSQPVKSIIGAKEVWLYNSQKRILQHYVANTENGLIVKGTSVMDFNGELSAGRKIRKPETLPTLMSGGYKTVTKSFDALKVKPTEVTGRSNEFTLVLKVVK